MRWPTDVRGMDACFNHGFVSTPGISMLISPFPLLLFWNRGFGGLPILAGQARCLSLVPAFAKAQLLLVLLLLLRFAPLVARFPLWHVGFPSLLLVFGLCSLTHVAGGFSWRCVLFALFEEGCVACHDALPVGQPREVVGLGRPCRWSRGGF